MTATLPNLPLIQERFFNTIKQELIDADIKYPVFEVLGVFKQIWGDTSLGFGGFGGQSMTAAYTTVIQSEDLGCVGVFFGERLAYVIKHPNETFRDDLIKRQMAHKRSKHIYEKQEV